MELKEFIKRYSYSNSRCSNSVIGSAKNITELILGLSTLADKIKF